MAASGQSVSVRRYTATVLAVAAGADQVSPVCEAPFDGTVTRVAYIPRTTITGANTDSRTLNVHNRKLDGTGTTVVATKAFTSGVNAPQYDATAITLTATAADLVVAKGDVLTVQSLHVGSTGLADPGGQIVVEISRT
jgi:hypothetical protein